MLPFVLVNKIRCDDVPWQRIVRVENGVVLCDSGLLIDTRAKRYELTTEAVSHEVYALMEQHDAAADMPIVV